MAVVPLEGARVDPPKEAKVVPPQEEEEEEEEEEAVGSAHRGILERYGYFTSTFTKIP